MAGLLDGITVLDLASVGPAVRASGWLADYGADVIKVAPVPRDADAQLTPKPHYYSGGRGTRRVQIDLKSRTPVATHSCGSPRPPTSSSRASGRVSSTGSASATTP